MSCLQIKIAIVIYQRAFGLAVSWLLASQEVRGSILTKGMEGVSSFVAFAVYKYYILKKVQKRLLVVDYKLSLVFTHMHKI